MTELSSQWTSFLSAETDAAATLTGLVVVAISINLARILELKHLPGRAAEALLTLVGTLLLASMWLIPEQSLPALGYEALSIGLAVSLSSLFVQWRSRKTAHFDSTFRKIIRAWMNVIPGIAFVIAGLMLIASMPGGLYWGAAGILTSFATSVLNAWILLVEIMR